MDVDPYAYMWPKVRWWIKWQKPDQVVDQVAGAHLVDQVVGAHLVDQVARVAGVQVVVDQVAGAQVVVDQAAWVEVVVDQVAGTQIGLHADRVAGAELLLNHFTPGYGHEFTHQFEQKGAKKWKLSFQMDVPNRVRVAGVFPCEGRRIL